MPTIEVSYKDLTNLIGKLIPIDELRDRAILYAKGEIETAERENLKIEIKDTNRPDLWSAEGLAREIRARYLSAGMPTYKVKKSNVVVKVDKKLENVRPCTVCAVVKNINLSEAGLSQIIQLQEKVSTTFGRNRREIAIGVYDFEKITPPITFTTVKPDGIKFTPLDLEKEMTPSEILKTHPKGRQFGHLLSGLREYPVFVDASGEILSMPPIINSNHTGKVTPTTRNLFVECSGFSLRFLLPALNIVSAALSDRKGSLESVTVVYHDKTLVTPDFTPKKTTLDLDFVKQLSGLNLSAKEVAVLAKKSGYEAKPKSKHALEILYPAYRQDIMHQADIAEDIIISYGYENIGLELPKLPTSGKALEIEKFCDTLADLLVGLGGQETMSYILTNKENLFKRMNLPSEKVAEIENIISLNWSVFRTSLLPGLLEFFSQNKNREYPQKIFEIGDTIQMKDDNTVDVKKLCFSIASNSTSYQEIASVLDAFERNLGLPFQLKHFNHPSLIPGRAAKILSAGKEIGFIGEVHPQVLTNFRLVYPVSTFELDANEIFRFKFHK